MASSDKWPVGALLFRLSPGGELNAPKGRAASRLGFVLHTIGVKLGRVHRRLVGVCQVLVSFGSGVFSGAC